MPAERKNATSVTSKVPTLLVLASAVGLLAIGGRMTLAGLAHFQTQAFLDSWVAPATEPAPRAWAVAEQAAQRAVAWYPVANGLYYDRLGLVYSWQQFQQPYGAAAAQNSRKAALAAYRAAVEARPTWPDSWTRLAHAKLYLLQFDDEFDQALQQAAALGPWRVGINRELTEIGLTAWPQLDALQQAAIIESARRAVAYGPTEARRTYQLAEHTGMTDLLCSRLDASLKSQRGLCQEK
jgi:hypothetical protein